MKVYLIRRTQAEEAVTGCHTVAADRFFSRCQLADNTTLSVIVLPLSQGRLQGRTRQDRCAGSRRGPARGQRGCRGAIAHLQTLHVTSSCFPLSCHPDCCGQAIPGEQCPSTGSPCELEAVCPHAAQPPATHPHLPLQTASATHRDGANWQLRQALVGSSQRGPLLSTASQSRTRTPAMFAPS